MYVMLPLDTVSYTYKHMGLHIHVSNLAKSAECRSTDKAPFSMQALPGLRVLLGCCKLQVLKVWL